ncbi:hypothetical protein LSAT2_009090 [Lamellibrachia satsuma]|nr:hypothetical protein LSAT2_009090 [Lamellibrachia satsuma]
MGSRCAVRERRTCYRDDFRRDSALGVAVRKSRHPTVMDVTVTLQPSDDTVADFMKASRRPRGKISVFKEMDETPSRFSGNLCPVNLEEQKKRFLQFGIAPKFVLRRSQQQDGKTEEVWQAKNLIRFDYFGEAKAVLDTVRQKYGDGPEYLNFAFGNPINYVQASEVLAEYLRENNAEGEMIIYWTPELTCSARMMWHGPSQKYNKPEARKFSLILNSSNSENVFLREYGIRCLADHEIGTHFFRMVNDGLQPWFSDRKKFGLRGMKTRDSVASEEGLAAVNTVLNAKSKYLWSAALVYYTACMAVNLTFQDLYDHLEHYVSDRELRWKHVMRVKRVLSDASLVGGSGHDQCYFEGAVHILRHIDSIDFAVLYSGKICLDEINRVHRLCRLDCIRMPSFMRDMVKYRRRLTQIAVINGLIPRPATIRAQPSLKRLNQSKQQPPAPVKSEPLAPSPPAKRGLSRTSFGGQSNVSIDRPRFTRPQQRPLVADSGSAPETVTLSSRATRVRSAKLRRAAAFASDPKEQPPRVPSRRRLRRKHVEGKSSRQRPTKVVSSFSGRLLRRPDSTEGGLLWKNNDVPPWQRSDCLSERVDVSVRTPPLLSQANRLLSHSTERICHRNGDSCQTQSTDSVLTPHPPRDPKRDVHFRRHPSFEDLATQTAPQRLSRPKVDRSLGILSRTES